MSLIAARFSLARMWLLLLIPAHLIFGADRSLPGSRPGQSRPPQPMDDGAPAERCREGPSPGRDPADVDDINLASGSLDYPGDDPVGARALTHHLHRNTLRAHLLDKRGLR
jgi:hypothetical protein